ncbi:MAG: hypothetical protein NVS9B3_08790 [Gemmatimonadaceae bacterium]
MIARLQRVASLALATATAVGMAFGPARAQEATGVVRGTVRSSATSAPIANVQVTVLNTRLGALTGEDGSFAINAVPSGAQRLRARILGYAPSEQSVTVQAGSTTTVDFSIAAAAVALDELVVTGTAGQARRREVGNAIGTIKFSEVPEAATDASALLQGRVPGVSVSGGSGNAGAGSSIRLRGNTSLALSNQPLIYVDGVRTRSDPYPKNVPATGYEGRSANVTSSPLNDINPDDIDRVEILKGAAATTLYGTEAAAGVIQIFTKRGVAGAAVWSAHVNQGYNELRPFGTSDAPYLFMEPWLRRGRREGYALSVGGGSVAGLRYFVSGGLEDNKGVLPLDREQKYSVRGNFGFTPIPKLTLEWSTSYTNDDLQNTAAGNNAHGLTLNAFRRKRNYFANDDPAVISQTLDYQLNTYIRRVILGGTATFTPFANQTNRFTVGLDRGDVENRNLRPFGFFGAPLGIISDQRWVGQTLTADYVGNLEWQPTPALRSTLGWGAQSATTETNDVSGYAEVLPGSGIPTVSSGAQFLAFESRQRVINAGFFLQNLFGFRERYFLTLGARVDGNSAFGSAL